MDKTYEEIELEYENKLQEIEEYKNKYSKQINDGDLFCEKINSYPDPNLTDVDRRNKIGAYMRVNRVYHDYYKLNMEMLKLREDLKEYYNKENKKIA